VRVTVLGIGSPQPGDGAGWEALETLRRGLAPPPGVRLAWQALAHPALDLLPALDGADAALLLDALAPGEGPSRLLRRHQLAALARGPLSGHGMSLAEMLALGGSLGLLPPRLSILGLGTDWPERATALARQWLAGLSAEASGA